MGSVRAVLYHEPSIQTILIQSFFLILLNVIESGANILLYCGLLGQIFVGLAWGTPGAQWLSQSFQDTTVQLGYLGLILLVYEGGLTTNVAALRANAFLSLCVAITGICAPIGASFTLLKLVDASPVQAFAAGAALCSTSLGTTFTILRSTGLSTTRMGVVLASAAMLDDVVGLVMVQVITNLGHQASDFSSTTVIRPVFVALAFGCISPIVARFIALPVIKLTKVQCKDTILQRMLVAKASLCIYQLLVLIGMVAASTYAGTSNLFAAYIAGATISWLDTAINDSTHGNAASSSAFDYYCSQMLNRILRPLFFASIGFSIPITQMFNGQVVWKGFVYATLMFATKFVCGIWLVRINFTWKTGHDTSRSQSLKLSQRSQAAAGFEDQTPERTITAIPSDQGSSSQTTRARANITMKRSKPTHTGFVSKPKSLYPATILGMAMVSRGEIGFLVSSLAFTVDIYNKDVFLVVTWAILLCTFIGPIAVGTLVKRLKKLEEKKANDQTNDVLGVWGAQE